MSALSDTFLAWYDFEAGALTTDASGHGLTLTNNNTVTSISGKVGNAAQFDDASAQYFSIADNANFSLGGTDAYWCYWVKLFSKDLLGKTFIAKDEGSSAREYFQKYFEGSDRFVFDTWTGASDTGNVRLTLANFGSPLINTWYFLQFWLDGTNMYGCVNNSTVDQVSAPGAGWNGNTEVLFGSLIRINEWYMDGQMDSFGFSKTIPSSGDRTWLYNAGAGRNWTDVVNKDVSVVRGNYYRTLMGAF
jgi:hypothetical protein